MGIDGGVVGDGDCSHDGEPESMSVSRVRASWINALERLEEPFDLIGRDERSAVRYRKERVALFDAGHDFEVAARHVVTHRVIEQVCDESFDEEGITLNRGVSSCGFNTYAHSVSLDAEVSQAGGDNGFEVDLLLSVYTTFTAGEGEQ